MCTRSNTEHTSRVLKIGVQGDVWLRVPLLNRCTSERCRVCHPDAELLQQQQALVGGWTELLNGHRQGHLCSSPDHCGRSKQPSLSLFSRVEEEKEKQGRLSWKDIRCDCESCITKKWMGIYPPGLQFCWWFFYLLELYFNMEKISDGQQIV